MITPALDKPRRRSAGFSLIEASILLIIIGLFFVPFALIYNAEKKLKENRTNTGRLSELQQSISEFVANYDRYPVPASLFSSAGALDYGIEFSSALIQDCAGWPTPSGVCRATGGSSPVLIGAVPFVTLGMNPDIAHDFWDNKIFYAVTESQTVAYIEGNGRIHTQELDINDNIVDSEPATPEIFDMVVLSTGSNGEGGFQRNGTAQIACGTNTELEDENCDMDHIFLRREAKSNFKPNGDPVSAASSVPGANYFDDFTEALEKPLSDSWLQHLVSPAYALTVAGRIGVGTTNPQHQVQVLGMVQAQRLLSDQICDATVINDCFDPTIIAGNVPQMDCNQNGVGAAGQAEPIVAVGNSQVYCASAVNTAGLPVAGIGFQFPAAFFSRTAPQCTALNPMIGIDAAGAPICKP